MGRPRLDQEVGAYRPAHEVPFYLSWPGGGLGAGTTDNRIVANIDIVPTILDAAGITPTHSQDGKSLLSSHTRDHPRPTAPPGTSASEWPPHSWPIVQSEACFLG
ncbi:sulfatase/phosphatase domain-containing protein [Streptomyces sp. NA02950]|uniref:sulfatase/phosphatase domain-containing protein n=1 Tax=Streptomyces sp. NA02950 TaxID=2742137 RepID=UPI0034CD3E96